MRIRSRMHGIMEVRVEWKTLSRRCSPPIASRPQRYCQLQRENCNDKGERKPETKNTFNKKKKKKRREREREREAWSVFPFIHFLDLPVSRSRKLVSNIPKNSKLRATHMGLNGSLTPTRINCNPYIHIHTHTRVQPVAYFFSENLLHLVIAQR